jgi:hypothetical protein
VFRIILNKEIFTVIAFQLYFVICYADKRKSGGTGIEWKTSTSLMGKPIIITKNIKILLDTSVEVNAEKIKFVFMSSHKTAGQNHNMKIADILLKNVAKFKYLGETVTNKITFMNTLNSGNACQHSPQNLSSFHLPYENIKIKILRIIILPFLYGYQTWEEDSLRVFENRVLRSMFGPKREEMAGGWRSCIMRHFIMCTLCHVLL